MDGRSFNDKILQGGQLDALLMRDDHGLSVQMPIDSRKVCRRPPMDAIAFWSKPAASKSYTDSSSGDLFLG